jgi:hypothetical protein
LLVEEWLVLVHFCLWDNSKYSANILVVSAGFVKDIGAVFNPVWERQKGSDCLLVI